MNAFLTRNSRFLGWVVLAWLCLPVVVHAADDLSQPPAALSDIAAGANEVLAQEDPIRIDDYAEPTPGGIGLMSSDQAGLPSQIWQGMSQEQAIEKLKRLPLDFKSRTLRNLALKLLIAEPDRTDLDEKFLLARVQRLQKGGQASLALKLLAAVPQDAASEILEKQRYALEMLAAGNSIGGLCKEAEEKQTADPQAFWQRFQVLCQAKQGEKAKAQLGLELLREQNDTPAAFEKLVHFLNDAAVPEVKDASADAEVLAWHALAGKLPEAKAETLPIEVLGLLGLNPTYAQAQREALKAAGVDVDLPRFVGADSPDVPLSLLQPAKDAGAAQLRKAFLAAAFRQVWEKPVSLEAEEKLKSLRYQANLTEISPLWRQEAARLMEESKPLEALLSLIAPFTQPLSAYTVGDIAHLTQELVAMGMSAQAALIAEEALAAGING